MNTRPVTHKFGGTSLADADRIRHVVDLLVAREDPAQVVVVSAMQGVTDRLIALGHQAAARDPAWREAAAGLRAHHLDAAEALLGQGGLKADFDGDFDALEDVLHALALVGAPSRETMAFVQGLGETFSARIVAATFHRLGHEAAYLDAREVLVVRQQELGAVVDEVATTQRLEAFRAAHGGSRVVITGFVARDERGHATTLGRNGSDHSSAIFAALFESPELHIWTDVDGVLSADPRLVPEAVLLPRISFDEACELAYFGAKVIHPQTMAPAIDRGISIRIRNSFRPEHEGTVIGPAGSSTHPIAGLTTIGSMALVNVEGAGMIGVPGTAERVFGALHRAGISVVMISQGSSEHSICCVIAETDGLAAVAALRDAFAAELERGQIQQVGQLGGISVLAVVGDGMPGRPGTSARLFEALGRSRINVRAIAQGASERNISVAIESRDAERALRAVHAGFYLSPQTLSVGLIGPGHVGAALLQQLHATGEQLRAKANVELRVRAVATSTRMLLDDLGMGLDDPRGWRERLEADGEPIDLGRLAHHVRASHLPHAVIADCSASDAVAANYAEWCGNGIHVVTPNKHAGSGDLDRYRAIRAACARTGARFCDEATVGAGLPILQTLRDLIDTGDEVLAIEGILSGTLAYLFHRFDGTTPFSQLVAEARENGFTEPDPRDDLSGRDVARKLVILGRELGREVSLDDVEVENLVPEALREGGIDAFLGGLARLDETMAQRVQRARAEGTALRYVARLAPDGPPTVGLVAVTPDHPFAHIRPTDNVVRFTTRRYLDNPLVVQGPGAGPDVTAAGVFSDLLRVAAGRGVRP